MAQLETRLIASLVDRISQPANKAANALKGLSKAANIKLGGGVFSGLDREIGRVNRQLADTRGRMLEVTAQAYVMAKALQQPIMAYADFEKGLVGLGQKSNKTLEQMKDIGKQFREMAPGMHQSPDALVGVMDTLVGAGVEFDVAKKSLGAISKASHAMNADIKSISDASVSFLQNMKIGADKLGEAWGIAAAAANAGKFELEDVAKQFPGVASFGAMRGMTGIEGERELLGILEGLSTRTATAEAAATQMRNILQKLDSQETTNRFSKAIKAENIRLQDAVKRHGKFDLGGTIMARARRMGISQVRAFVDITQEVMRESGGKIRLSDLISDAEFLSGMQNIIDGLRDIDSIISETKKNSAGFLDKAQAERAKTLSSKLADLSNAFSGLNIEIGTSLASTIGNITERLKGLTELVRNLSAAHPNLIRNVTIATAGFVALNVGIVALRYSFLSLKAATLGAIAVSRLFIATPLGLTLTVIAGAVYLLYQNWDKIKQLMPNVAKAVEDAVTWMKNNWAEIPTKVGEVVTSIKNTILNTDWMQVGRDMISGLWTGMKEWLNRILAGVGEYVGKIKGLFVGSAEASTGGSATSPSGSTGGGSYSAVADRMRRLSGGGASGGTPGITTGGGASPRGAGAETPSRSIGGVSGVLSGARSRGGATPNVAGAASAATGGSGLLDRIARAEGTAGRGDYNTVLGYGRYGTPNKPLTEMTLAEAFAFGRQVKSKHGRSSALGRYQIVGNTMKIVMPKLGLKWSDKFSAANQDAMARVIYRMQGLGAWEGFKRHARRARGGPVHAGQSYVVGERGPEVFRPSRGGSIFNQQQVAAQGRNASHGGSNVTFHATFNITGATDATHVARTIKNEVRSLFRGSHSDLGFAAT